MAVSLSTSVYTAGHGYGWSSVPSGVDARTLEALRTDALSLRPDFAEENAVTSGIAVRNGVAAAFAIRRAPAWDSVGRAADYAAFAFVPCGLADNIDFATLLANEFFLTPTHTPPARIAYDGAPSAPFPPDAAGRLLCRNRLDGFDPHAAGTLLARHGLNADRWLLRVDDHGAFTITTTPWHK